MVKVYLLMRGDKAIGEIRTDLKHYEVFNDMSNGLAAQLGHNSWDELNRKVGKSSYLHLVMKQEGLPGILRYVLDSGDVVEATSDGLTYLLNGRLLNPQEAQELQQKIHSGVVTVSQKQDIKKPIPVQAKYQEAPQYTQLKDEDREQSRQDFSAAAQEVLAKQAQGSVDYDPGIEAMDVSDMERPSTVKDMAYYLKYGKFQERP